MKRTIGYLLCASFLASALAFTGCSNGSSSDDDEKTPAEKDQDDDENQDQDEDQNQDEDQDDDEDASVIPDYADDYRRNDISWNGRSNWNLANVHDPSVEKWDDGYYYMYQTDASYGNVHTGNGHFYGRRSKDLVYWESVGMALPEDGAKRWIFEKVNEFRRKMNLQEFASVSDIQWGYWAPTVKVVTKSNGTKVMRMYYDVVVENFIYSGRKEGQGFDNSWTERAFIGMAETTNPADKNSWQDKGYVLCSSSAKGSRFPQPSGTTASSSASYYRSSTNDWRDAYFYFNAIDPTYITGNHNASYCDTDYMIYGSWHHGFAGVEIDRDSGLVKGHFTKNADGTYTNTLGDPWADSPEGLAANGYGTRVYCRGSNTNGWQGSEGPEVMYNPKDQKYYMFFANDALDVPYHTRVVRSDNPISGYTDIFGRGAINSGSGKGDCFPIVTHPYKFKNSNGWVGISHCGIIEKDGEWYFTSQGRLPAEIDTYSNAVMMGQVRKILWCPNGTDTTNLWPIASPERYANISNKKAAITEADIAGKWEHINLVYSYGKQAVSEYVTFGADKSVSGMFNGTWSFDSETKYLTVTFGSKKPGDIKDSSIILVLDRELDWEVSPRKATIVYAGISSAINNVSPITFWGKRVE